MNRPYLTIGSIILLVLFAILQQSSWLTIVGVKPNLTLVFLIVLIFFLEDPFFYILLVVLHYFLLRLEPAIDWPVFIQSLLLVASFWLAKIFPWQPLGNLIVLIILNTALLYGILSFQFLTTNVSLVTGELLYNVVIGVTFYELGKRKTTL